MKKRVTQVLFVLVLLLNFLIIGNHTYISAYNDNTGIEEKSFCHVSLDEDFADDTVLIVLNKNASAVFKNYLPSDFSEVGCSNIEDLTEGVVEKIYEQQTNANETKDFVVNETNFRRILKLTLVDKGKEKVIEAIKKLEKRNDVISVAPDYYASFSTSSTNDLFVEEQWAIEKIGLPQAWEITTGSSLVKVGVIDSGIDADHSDLINRVNRSLSRSFSEDNVSPFTDIIGHGTHVAGIIGAQSNNQIGVTGACWNITLVSLKVDNANGSIKKSYMVSAISYATQVNIPILNCSIGFEGEYDTDIELAIRNYPGIFITAAGNSDTSTDLLPELPSCYDLDNIISVASSNYFDRISTDSNYGKYSVDLFAPGDTILSTYPTNACIDGTHDTLNTIHYTNGYHYSSGTSMASPYVAGVAALLLSKYPFLNAYEIKDIILRNVDIITENGNSVFGNLCVSGGRLNAYKALNNFRMLSRTDEINIYSYLNYGQGKFVVFNHGSGFMNFSLQATDNNGNMISCPQGAISIKDNAGNLLKKCNFDSYNVDAMNVAGINNFTFFFPQTGYYYIDVNFNNSNLNQLILKTMAMTNTSINMFNYNENDQFEINMVNGAQGDAIKFFSLGQAGKFQISFTTTNLNQDVLFVLFKRNSSSAFSGLDVIASDYYNSSFTLDMNLDAGEYYIGYFDNFNNSNITINLKRLITSYGGDVLVTDPTNKLIAGSEVVLNGGKRGENTITSGFTRIIYFDQYNGNAPSVSRLDYYWFSSNESVATVSDYATVLALPVRQDTTVKIMVVYKYDSSIVFIKEFVIKKETSTTPITINHAIIIRKNVYTSIDLTNVNVPINILQFYEWESLNPHLISVNYLGQLYATTTGTAVIKGTYFHNNRVKIYLSITIIS